MWNGDLLSDMTAACAAHGLNVKRLHAISSSWYLADSTDYMYSKRKCFTLRANFLELHVSLFLNFYVSISESFDLCRILSPYFIAFHSRSSCNSHTRSLYLFFSNSTILINTRVWNIFILFYFSSKQTNQDNLDQHTILVGDEKTWCVRHDEKGNWLQFRKSSLCHSFLCVFMYTHTLTASRNFSASLNFLTFPSLNFSSKLIYISFILSLFRSHSLFYHLLYKCAYKTRYFHYAVQI